MTDESYFRNEFRDSRIETLIQAQSVHVQANKPPKPMEAALPPRHWVDRRDALDSIAENLAPPNQSPVVIVGPAGVGKTALMQQAAAAFRERYPDGQLYIDLAAERPVSALRSVLMRLGEPKDQLADTLGGLLSHYRSATRDSSMLVLVDGVDRAQEGLLFQPNSPRSAIMLSAEQWPDDPDVNLLHLEDLAADDAATLLRNFCPWIADADADALITVHGRSPSNVRRLAGLIRARQRSGSESETAIPELLKHAPDNLLTATFQALSPSAAWLFELFSVFPSEEIERSVLSALETPDHFEEAAFDELVNAQLLTLTRPGWYRIEPAGRVAAEEIGDTGLPLELATAMRQALRWYLRRAHLADVAIMGDRLRLGWVPDDIDTPAFDSVPEALAWFQRNHTALLAALRVAVRHGWRTEAWSLAEAMWAFYTNTPFPTEAERCYRLAASATDSAVAEARILVFHGKALTDLRRFDEADEVLQQALALATAEQHVALIGTATELRGRLLHKRGRPEAAIEYYQAARENARTRGRVRSEAWQLMFLGQAYRDLGELSRARGYFDASLKLFIDVEDGRTATLARYETVMLELAAESPGATADAVRVIEWLHQLRLITHEARALARLGTALGGDEGQRYLEDALEIYERFGDVEADRLRHQLL